MQNARKTRKMYGFILTAAMMISSLAACHSAQPAQAEKQSAGSAAKIAVIRNSATDDHAIQFVEGCRAEGESLGYQVDMFLSNNEDARFQELVDQAIQGDYDGLVISHGKADYSYDLLKPAVEKGIKLVLFDTLAEKDGAALEGVTSTAQNDFLLAELSLEHILKEVENRPVKILKLWFGPGEPPLDRRNSVYEKYEKDGLIETVQVVGPTDWHDVQGSVANSIAALLPKYPENSIDAVWASWDELAKGAYKSFSEAGRTDIPIISIDVSNQDINFMRESPEMWRATAAVDPNTIGRTCMRLMAKKLKGEETPSEYNFEPHLILSDQIQENTNMDNLADIVEGWNTSAAFHEPWMDEMRTSD